MLASTATAAGDSRPDGLRCQSTRPRGDCGDCHTTTPTFATNLLPTATKPANHIPTTARVLAVPHHGGQLRGLLGHRHAPGRDRPASPATARRSANFINVTIVTTPAQPHPDRQPRLQRLRLPHDQERQRRRLQARHRQHQRPDAHRRRPQRRSAAAVARLPDLPREPRPTSACSPAPPPPPGTRARPPSTRRTRPAVTAATVTPRRPTFTSNCDPRPPSPPTTSPTTAACTQCHTTAGNYALYSVTGVHQGVTACLTCHAPAVAGTFANITIVTTRRVTSRSAASTATAPAATPPPTSTPAASSSAARASTAPTLNVAGHTTIASAVGTCCHLPRDRPVHRHARRAPPPRPGTRVRPRSMPSTRPRGDCGNCHVPRPTFATNLLPTATKPANHIPTTAVCSQCHTTAGNFAVYSVTGVHQGVTACLTCHGPTVAARSSTSRS